ncbi:MAG: YncE family protein [Thermodesulfobacteriota bacterium]|nr:MAG: YncE family protein [Thermodesulfobacteriota bacterium]
MTIQRLLILFAIIIATLFFYSYSASSPKTSKPPDRANSSHLSSQGNHNRGQQEIHTIPGMPPVIDPTNIYSEAAADKLEPALNNIPHRVYVPNEWDGTVSVIDPKTFKVIDHYPTGKGPQHIIPSWDKKRLWVLNNEGNSLTPIDPLTGKPGPNVHVDDPYNLYFTPDGKYAIVVAEARHKLDFRDPETMALKFSVPVACRGVNHLDFSIDGRYAVASCEFAGKLIKIDMVKYQMTDSLELGINSMPQDVRLSADGTTFYIADLMANGVHLIDGDRFKIVGFIPTGKGAHGLLPSRDGKKLYVSNRGWSHLNAGRHGQGSIAVIDFATRKVIAQWLVPGGGSPDMGNLNIEGSQLWLGGRYDNEVYCFDTNSGKLIARISVGDHPHGLAYWPLPGRYSLGHTGNMR